MHYRSLNAVLEQYSSSLTHHPFSPNSFALHIGRQTQGYLKFYTPDGISLTYPFLSKFTVRRPVRREQAVSLVFTSCLFYRGLTGVRWLICLRPLNRTIFCHLIRAGSPNLGGVT